MKNKFQLQLMLLTIIIVAFPSICFSELKTVEGEYCDVYLGDLKNKKELNEFRQTVKNMSIKDGILKLVEKPWHEYAKNEYYLYVINNYLEKVVVLKHSEKSRKICYKVRITADAEVINKYLSQVTGSTIPEGYEIVEPWIIDVNNVLKNKSDKINIGLIVETKIPSIDLLQKEKLENKQEEEFYEMIKWEENNDKYKYLDRRHLNKVLEEQKLSSSGLTDSDTVKIGKLLNLDIIVLRLIYNDSLVTKVLKVDTGEVLLFKTYEEKIKETGTSGKEPNPDIWEYFGENWYYNKTNMTKSSNIISVWTYYVVTDDDRKESIEKKKKDNNPDKSLKYQSYEHDVDLTEIDCKKKLVRTKEVINYDDKGNILDRITDDNPKWESIIPGSVGEGLYRELCVTQNKSPKKKK